MHPPLDRPHPECMDIVQALKDCHAQKYSKLFFWRCNDLKVQLDTCFKTEKENTLKILNKDTFKIRNAEEKASSHTMSFDDYLNLSEDERRKYDDNKSMNNFS